MRRKPGRPKKIRTPETDDRLRYPSHENPRFIDPPEDTPLTRSNGVSEPLKSAVLAALLLGQSATVIAQQFNLPPATVAQWESSYAITSPLQRRDRISEMLVVFVEQELASLIAISLATSDDDWIKMQNAHDIASLIEVKHDKLIRILEAFGRANTAVQHLKSQQIEADGEDDDDSDSDI